MASLETIVAGDVLALSPSPFGLLSSQGEPSAFWTQTQLGSLHKAWSQARASCWLLVLGAVTPFPFPCPS